MSLFGWCPVDVGMAAGVARDETALVLCLAKISVDKQNLDLIEELKDESAGIFNWLMQGAVDLTRQDGHIFVADAIKVAVDQQRQIMDPHRVFLREVLVATDHTFWLPSVEMIYARYCRWMRDRGFSGVLAWPRLRSLMTEIYPQAKAVQQRYPHVGKARGYSGIFWADAIAEQQFEDERAAARLAKQVIADKLKDVQKDVAAARSTFRQRTKAEREAGGGADVGSDLADVFREAGIEDIDQSAAEESDAETRREVADLLKKLEGDECST